MRNLARFLLAAAVCFQFTSCSKNSPPPAAAQTESADPAQANLAPVNQQSDVTQPAPQPVNPPAPQPVAQETSYPEDNDSSQPPVYAEQPPPPIPQYSQPECPGPNYLWTPGSWNYASTGYYWVPGVWVLAPFVGALWTPAYWAFDNNRYRWHHGYWGSHIGFYGGINYGFGYVGRRYEGGYWNRGNFAYNRTVNNVNISVVKNVYNYRVTNITNVRTSYVGGRGGLEVRPTAAEMAVVHERRIAPLPEQVQHIRQAAGNKSQFADVNHGRPETAAATRPLEISYHAPAAHAAEVPGARVLPPAETKRAETPRTQPVHPETNRAELPRSEPVRPESRPAPAAKEAHQDPRPSAPQPHLERTEPERRPAPEARPTPQARDEKPHQEQAKPAPRPEARPEPNKPEPKKEEGPKREEHHPPLA